MRIIIQRVKQASVTIDQQLYSSIGYGYLLLVGFEEGDSEHEALVMAKKVSELRICEDEQQKMNLSIQDIGGEILSVSQFTLYADCRKGRRPSFTKACPSERAKELYAYFNQQLQELGLVVKSGVFHADMKVDLINDGPVTIILDSQEIVKNGK